jgi:Protein of unknown function (DUF2510)
VVSNPPAGWYPDPQQPDHQRYWDGSEWTEHFDPQTLVDATFRVGGIVRSKEKRLVVTSEGLSWGDERVRWDEVTSFSQLVTIQSGYETMFEIWIVCGDRVVHLLIPRMKKRDQRAKQAYQAIIGVLKRTVAPRILAGLLQDVDAGSSITFAKLRLSPEGFAHEGKRGETIPWSDYAGMEVRGYTSIILELFRLTPGGKRKRACRLEVDLLHGWLLPPLVEEHARRYASLR